MNRPVSLKPFLLILINASVVAVGATIRGSGARAQSFLRGPNLNAPDELRRTLRSARFLNDLTLGPEDELPWDTSDGDSDFASVILEDVEMHLQGAQILSNPYIEDFEDTLEDWFDAFYDSKKACQSQARRLIEADAVTTKIKVSEQQINYGENGVANITIIYDQWIKFRVASSRRLLDCGSDTDAVLNVDDLTIGEVAVLPYQDEAANEELGLALQANFPELSAIEFPISEPALPEDENLEQEVSSIINRHHSQTSTDDDTPVILTVAIAVAGTAVVAGLLALMYHIYKFKVSAKEEGQKEIPEAAVTVVVNDGGGSA